MAKSSRKLIIMLISAQLGLAGAWANLGKIKIVVHWRKEWLEEDKERSLQEITKRAVDGSMQEVYDFLRFTTETEEEFEDGWLPTLDLGLQVRNNRVWHKFYEKLTTSKVTVQERSAMEEVVKSKILSNDLTRRLFNTMEGLPREEWNKVVDGYGQKLLTSGFSREKEVEILVAGIRCYERKVRRCRKNGWSLYRTAKGSMKSRQMKKLIGNKSWYRQKRKREEEEVTKEAGQGKGRKQTEMKEEEGLEAKTVLFVQYTPGGSSPRE